MLRLESPLMNNADFLNMLPAAMAAVGTARFEKQLADAMGSMLDYDFITMARYSVHSKPCFLIHSHTFPSHMAELYLSQFVDADPYVGHWRSAEQPGVVWLQDIASKSTQYERYTDVFLPQIGVKDEIGVFLPAVGRDSVAFFYIRRRCRFSADDVMNIRRVFEVGAALYRVHLRALLGQGERSAAEGSPSLGSPLRLTSDTGGTIWFTNEWSAQERPDLTFVRDEAAEEPPDSYHSTMTVPDPAGAICQRQWIAGLRLTRRESDIVDLALKGYANANIASTLSMSVGNVKNHKRRIYAKLDIQGERELFAMYIKTFTEV